METTLQSFNHVPEPSYGSVFEWMVGPVRMAVLDAALKLGVADLLIEPAAPGAIAEALGVEGNAANLGYFLDAMTAMGFARKKDGVYSNTSFAESFMRTDSPAYFGGLVENLSRMQHRNLGRIADLVRQGPPEVAARDVLDSEDLWKQSVRHLAAYHKAGMADRVGNLVASLPEFSAMRRMLDLGSGPGVMCMGVVARHPSMKGVLCDQPPVMEVAREEIAAAGLEGRVTTISGDYNSVDFGSGYDLIWASQTLYYARNLDEMFTRIHDALNPGGVFVSLHEGLACERTQPANLVLSRLSLALEGQDVSFGEGELASYLPGAGFSLVETRMLEMPLGPHELIIARKRG